MNVLNTLGEGWQRTPIHAWYRSRDARDQRIVVGLSLIVAVSLAWLLIWKPISDWHARSVVRLQNAESTLAYIKLNEDKARSLASSSSTSTRSVIPIVTRAADLHGLTLNRLQPESDGSVSVMIQAQPFNAVFEWIDVLGNKHGLTAARVNLSQEGTPGLVNAQIRFR